MTYLLDANVLIRANAEYYPLDRLPRFWMWLLAEASDGRIKMPFEIHDEVASGSDALAEWIGRRDIRDALVLDAEVDDRLFNRVLDEAYAPDLTDTELEEAGRDPFLVAYAMREPGWTVVTKEVSKMTQTRGRRKLPDACSIMGVRWIPDFTLYRERDFRIP
ncbi:DUF4411 family protein [Methylocystis sp. H4A]|uniref:DUF4411 family protein n=1 Tax=Methylocystis sp. H4A TaxID=2785788 RepID=UPI0018C1FF84|nr:DUF4411 family protein [Methylocystis sp. H4A]MBG0801259.1 DUF4411 family protein [Methylocystis sp. H4A]